MKNLEMTEAKAAKLSEVEDLALGTVREALKGINPADSADVKLASHTLSMVAKNRQTLTARQAIGFSMASAIGSDKELKRYISITNPEVKKALSGKVKK